jgi:uncharacterized protein YjiS (DUF1127 family)
MTDLALAPCRLAAALARQGEQILRLIARIERAVQVRRERRMLLRLGDGMLKDLGLDRGSAYAEGTRAFWDVPADSAQMKPQNSTK